MTTQDDYWKQKILSAIGKPVHFEYKYKNTTEHGILKDRFCMPSPTSPNYFNSLDLILFGEREELRLTYWHLLPTGKIKFAGQTSLCEPLETVVDLFTKAGREKSWFKKIIEKVYENLSDSSEPVSPRP